MIPMTASSILTENVNNQHIFVFVNMDFKKMLLFLLHLASVPIPNQTPLSSSRNVVDVRFVDFAVDINECLTGLSASRPSTYPLQQNRPFPPCDRRFCINYVGGFACCPDGYQNLKIEATYNITLNFTAVLLSKCTGTTLHFSRLELTHPQI